MSSKEKVTDYFQSVVAALDKDEIDKLTFSRRSFYSVKPADPSFSVDFDERQELKEQLTKLAKGFWQNEDIDADLENVNIVPYPELEEYHGALVTVATHKEKLADILNKFPKAPQAVLEFYRNYFPATESSAIRLYKQFSQQAASNKLYSKWNNKIYAAIVKGAPEILKIHPQKLHIKTGSKFFGSNKDTSESSNTWLIFVIIWIVIKLITMASK